MADRNRDMRGVRRRLGRNGSRSQEGIGNASRLLLAGDHHVAGRPCRQEARDRRFNVVARNGVPWELKTDGEGLGWGRDSESGRGFSAVGQTGDEEVSTFFGTSFPRSFTPAA